MRESFEVLRDASEKKGIKALAAELKLSQALLYKWCQKPAGDDEETSGALNPLDRVKMIYELTGEKELINWLCNSAGGFYSENPKLTETEEIMNEMKSLIKEFSHLLEAVSASSADNVITKEEAAKIRKEWEELKSTGETMAVTCESCAKSRKKPPK